MPELDPDGRPVPVGRAIFYTPGLAGAVTASEPLDAGGFRSGSAFTENLRTALEQSDVRPMETYEISDAREVPTGVTGSRSSTGEPGVVLQLPALADGWVQVILASDEADVLTWHLAEPAQNTEADATDASRGAGATDASRGAGALQTFIVRRTVPPAAETDESASSRGLISAIGRKILQVLVFKVVEVGGGLLAEWTAQRWESAKRPYRVRDFAPDNYTLAEAPLVENGGWQRLAEGRALLVVHGTFSRAHSGFGGCPPSLIEDLYKRYQGRVFAFDHFTLSQDPGANVDEFLTRIPSGTDLDLDVLCHSRGGLVARSLAARQGDLSVGDRRLQIGKVVFVAAPNGGTILADGDYMGQFVDRYTNLLTLLPDNAVLDILTTIVDVVKHAAVGALDTLDGLKAMRPTGDFLATLPAGTLGGNTTAYCVSADYEPHQKGAARLLSLVRDGVTDRVFGDAENDLVVPTTSGWELGGGKTLALGDQLRLKSNVGVSHTSYFGNATVQTSLKSWLKG